ncbi:MAG: NifB/NifX family molybdenum-iron cluster-binding protein [Candidatus Eisenbacteria bacterium]|nr:NifB/NifX family molybdenum-iron cluster-binding protein [Candidatus Eisenbacteria bacterium]
MMKAAFAAWNNRIAPVFDVAGQIRLVETEDGQVVRETQETITDDLPAQKALRLAELGVGILVCGAISKPLHEMVAAYGIRVVPFMAGSLQEIIGAWLTGDLDWNVFAMPGCCGRRRLGGTYGLHREDYVMNGRKGGGMEQGGDRGQGGGGGRGQGRGGQRPGRMGGPKAAGPTGTCVCPKCGQREPHERGVPCVERKCPKCGAAMSRE